MAGQRTMSGLISALTSQTFVLLVMLSRPDTLAGHILSGPFKFRNKIK